MTNLFRSLWLTTLVLLLAACGGGDSNTAAVATPLSISQQPVSVSTMAGASAVFSVVAAGDGLVYQWQVSQDNGTTWTDIPGAVSATYTVQVVTPDLNGYEFRVKLGSGGGLISSAATLTATAAVTPVAITVQPGAQTASVGATATFSVTATGTSLSYQWQVSTDGTNWTDIAGATNATYTTGVLAASDNGTSYRAVIKNSVGSVTSDGVSLTVNAVPAAPTIGTQPVNFSATVGQTATFTVATSGTAPLTFQWQVSIDAGTTFVDIAGATGASYATPATTVADDGKVFRVSVSNAAGSVVSSNAALSVAAVGVAPVINSSSVADETVMTPFTGTFSVIASGSPTPTYQWQLSVDGGSTFTNVNGATASSYTTPATSPADAGTSHRYRAIVSNSAGSAVSHPAVLTIIDSGMGGSIGGVAIDPAGNLYASIGIPNSTSLPDTRANFSGIQKLSTAGAVSVLAGNSQPGFVNGTGSAAKFYSPLGIAADAAGNIYVADWGVNAIRKVTPAGVVTTLAGGDIQGGFVDGVGVQASFYAPESVAVDSSGNVYVADRNNAAVRKIAPDSTVTTIAGGPTSSANLGAISSIACDTAGNIYVSAPDSVHAISPSGAVTAIATSGTPGIKVDPNSFLVTSFYAVAVDAAGNVYVLVADDSAAIKKLSGGSISTVVSDVETTSNSFAIDAFGTIYVATPAADAASQNYHPYEIRKITPSGATSELP